MLQNYLNSVEIYRLGWENPLLPGTSRNLFVFWEKKQNHLNRDALVSLSSYFGCPAVINCPRKPGADISRWATLSQSTLKAVWECQETVR